MSQNGKKLLSKEDKMARLLTSSNRKETNTTHTDEDKIKNNPENNAESSLEPVQHMKSPVHLFYLKKVSFFSFLSI